MPSHICNCNCNIYELKVKEAEADNAKLKAIAESGLASKTLLDENTRLKNQINKMSEKWTEDLIKEGRVQLLMAHNQELERQVNELVSCLEHAISIAHGASDMDFDAWHERAVKAISLVKENNDVK